ncbi:helix-turn-helix domain-containing protein [Sphaerisporangium rhizosphaerae]|uniref:Helix-turn-helix domain-containing protein n=1 Tax=Sphaerisporangium rhizosphaerae TaxID=2269375 RepID=A0ABW2PA14_9ACTN
MSSAPTGPADRTDLGAALRHWRDRLPPGEVGLPSGGVRRAPGLRREELAQLAGLSVDYVVRLERGRATTPSAQVLAALSRALRLSVSERDHLYLLAGRRPPGAGQVSQHIPPSVQRLCDQLARTPLSVYDASWTLLTWNPLWGALTGDPSTLRGRDRNIVWRHFAGFPSRVAHLPGELVRFEAALVSDLRSSLAAYPEDERLRTLVDDLREHSRRFGELWAAHAVGRYGIGDTKVVHHPDVGAVTVDCDVLTVPGSDLRIVVYSAPPGTTTAAQLELLNVVGTQPMTSRRPA